MWHYGSSRVFARCRCLLSALYVSQLIVHIQAADNYYIKVMAQWDTQQQVQTDPEKRKRNETPNNRLLNWELSSTVCLAYNLLWMDLCDRARLRNVNCSSHRSYRQIWSYFQTLALLRLPNGRHKLTRKLGMVSYSGVFGFVTQNNQACFIYRWKGPAL